MKKQCLNCGSFQKVEATTCLECNITNQFRVIKEVIKLADIPEKSPVGQCPNCNTPIENKQSKCPQCKILFKKQPIPTVQKPKHKHRFSQNGNVDYLLNNFSLT